LRWSITTEVRSGESDMSSSSRREVMAAGVGDEAERARRTFPPKLMKSRSFFGESDGP